MISEEEKAWLVAWDNAVAKARALLQEKDVMTPKDDADALRTVDVLLGYGSDRYLVHQENVRYADSLRDKLVQS